MVKVGHYETSGSNHVEEEWFKHDKLTELMHHYIRRLIGNTRTLLEQAGKAGPGQAGLEAMVGTLSPHIRMPSTPKRARLKQAENSPIVKVPWTGTQDPQWGSSPAKGWDLAKVKFVTPPVFYVLEESGGESKVMGADVNT
jgi:hypothetical protein